MPFVDVNIDEEIEKSRAESESFRKAWDESREEYGLIGEMVSLRNQAMSKVSVPFEEVKTELLKNEEVRREYEKLKPC